MNIRTFAISTLVVISSFFSLAAYGTTRTVTLDVPGMTCSLCPITVKKALMKVPGVASANVSYEGKQAIVTYDDARTNPDALVKATGDAGYPSTIKKGK